MPVTTHGYPLVNVMREDVAEKGTDRDLLMRNVKQAKMDLFKCLRLWAKTRRVKHEYY